MLLDGFLKFMLLTPYVKIPLQIIVFFISQIHSALFTLSLGR